MRRPATHTAEDLPDESRRTGGHARFIGRVGALAVFLGLGLGVGAVLAMPTAQADSDDGSSLGASTSSASTSASTFTGSDSAGSDSAGSDSESESDDDGPTTTSAGNHRDRVSAGTDTSQDDPDIDAADDADSFSQSPDAESQALTAADADLFASPVTRGTRSSVTEAPAVPELTEESDAGVALPDSDDPVDPAVAHADWSVAAYARRQIGAPSAVADTAAAAQSGSSVDDGPMSNQVSPLGTPQQIERERIAIQTAESLPVAIMKVFLRWGFRAAAEEQFALVGGPDEANLDLLGEAVDEYALAASFQQQILNPMDPAVVTQVAPPHSWYGLDVGGSRLLYDNPDTIYRFMPVNKTAEYVLTGRILEGVPADTTFSVLEGLTGTTSTILSLQDLDISEDGSFVITVSGEPAAPGQRNHLQLTSSSTLIAARNTLGDWNTEEPMELAVHRVSGPPNSLFAQLGGFVFLGPLVNDRPFLASLVSIIPPLRIADSRPVRGTLTALILLVRGTSEEAKYMSLATTDPDTGELRPPNTMTEPASNAEFLANQLQSNGYFQLADDEALVLTIDQGNSGFFTVPVYNDWTITDDYWNQQTSLNNDQAIANADGSYTMVVSIADPLVANWVSTGGLNQGIISMRFQNLDPDSPETPTVQSVVVKLEDLDEHLPAGTVYLTPEERAAQLAARKAGYDKRWAPYLQA